MPTNKDFGDFHAGISMHHIGVGAGFAGVVFTVGSMFIFLVGVPGVWAFFALSLGLGLLIATGLYFLHRRSKPPLDIR